MAAPVVYGTLPSVLLVLRSTSRSISVSVFLRVYIVSVVGSFIRSVLVFILLFLFRISTDLAIEVIDYYGDLFSLRL